MKPRQAASDWSFDPSVLESVTDFDWLIRALAKGVLFGGRHSLRLGAGMEFSQYRPYSQGDDLRRLDWKMYGRTERFYIKQSEIETDIQFNLVVDHSLSMTYAEDGISKLNYAKLLTALFAYVALKNGDGFSLISSEKVLPPAHGDKQWQRCLHDLMELHPSADFHLRRPIQHNQPGISLVFSDFFGEGDEWLNLLQNLNLPGNEIFAFHIIGPAEQSMDFSGSISFEDLENQKRIQVDTRKQSESYRKKFAEWKDHFKSDLMKMGIWYEPILLGTHPGQIVQTFLRKTRTNFAT